MRICPAVGLIIATLFAAVSAAGQHQRVVCYYTNWSVYRPGNAKFSPQNINPYLCTHLIYAFGGLTKENGLRPFDKYQDIEQGGYAKFNGLKSYNKQLKTLLAIGGWNEGSARFSPLVADSERRVEFVKNVVRFLRTNHFDGLDLDWEYPAFRDGGKPRDRANYALLVQELRAEFDRESSKTGRERLLLTMAVPAGTEYVDKGYDVPSLNKHLDFFNILSYDYHSAFEPVVNHHAPLYSGGDPDNEYNFDAQLSIEHTVKHYVTMGADRDKLVLGIPTYGRSYTLFNPLATELGSAADGPGEQGDATREKGYLAYYEICENVKKNSWTVERPKPEEMGPIAYKGNQWVGYDDEDIVRVKAQYVAAQGLGGIMFWSIDNDDFRGKCHDRPYPLIEAGKEALLAATKGSDGKRTKPVVSSGSSKPARRRPTSSVSTSVRNGDTTSSKRRRPAVPAPRASSSTTTTSTTPVPPNLQLLNTPEPPTTPDPGSDFVCKDEGFFPHPRDCKKYFWCLDSGPSQLGIVAHQFTCPSGLVFNKNADSCDYARNVICNKNKPTTTTTAAPTTQPVSTTRSPLFRTTTTTTTTTPAPPEEEEEYEEEYEEEVEEDPKAIKELLDLIKRLGGVEQLEKQLGGAREEEEIPVVPEVAERPNISKSLYQRVLGSRNRAVTNSGGGPALISAERTRQDTSERKLPLSLNTRSRGPQNQGLDDLEEVRGLKKEKPKYVEIRRPSRPSTRPTSEEEEEPAEELDEEEYEEEEVAPRVSTSRPIVSPKYTSIRRERPSSTAAPEQTEAPQQEQPKRKYVFLNRGPSSTTTQAPIEESVEFAEDDDEVPAEVREVPPPPKTTLEFEGRVEEVTKVGYRRGNTLRRHTTDELNELNTTYPQKEDLVSVVNAEPTRATSGFYITKAPTQRVFVVNAVTTPRTTRLPEVTLTTEPSLTTTTQELPTTLEEVTSITDTEPPTEAPTEAPLTTSTSTSIVTSITEDPMYGRKKIKINRKLNFTIPAKTEAPTTPMTTVEDSTEALTTTFEPEIIEKVTTTTPKSLLRKKRPPFVRKRPISSSKPTEETSSFKPTAVRRRRPSSVTRANVDESSVVTEAIPGVSPRRFQRKRIQIVSSTTPEPSSTTASRRRFRPARPTASAEEATPRTLRVSRPSSEVNEEFVSPARSFRPFRTTTESHDEEHVTPRTFSRTQRPSSDVTEETSSVPARTYRPFKETSDDLVTPSRTFRPSRPTEAPVELDTTVRTPTRRRKVIRIRGRASTTPTTTTSTTPIPVLEYSEEEVYDDSGPTASGNEVFQTSQSQSGPNQDEDVLENVIPSQVDEDDVQYHQEAFTTTSSEAPVTTTARPLVSLRPINRRPAFPARVRATTSAPEPVTEQPQSTQRTRVAIRRKFRPFKDTEKGREVDALTSSTRSSRRRQPTYETTTVAVAETSPLLSQSTPAVYYTRQPLEEEAVTPANIDPDYDLVNGAVAALTNLATSPPSAPGAIYEDIPSAPAAPDHVEEVEVVVPTPSPTFSPSTTHKPRLSTTLAPRKSQRAQAPSSSVSQQRPFTRIRDNSRTPASTRYHVTSTTQGPLDFEDYYDDEIDPSIPTSSKVQIHEDGSLECLDRGNFAHPFSCRKFISCALMENGALLGWIYTCPKHLAFDPIGGICNWSGGCKE